MSRLKINTIASIISQATVIACGFILPRLLLRSFGSDVNGLISSITQFLQVIAFLELGVGAVVESSLYKPLSEHDNTKVSQIITSATRFYRKIALALLIYVIILVFVYPGTVGANYKYNDVVILIIAISINSFAQYYFGTVNTLLLGADLRSYIVNIFTIITTIANTIICVVLIKTGATIQIVKVASAMVLLIKPLALKRYISTHYSINYKEAYENEPISQKWYGIAQHFAAVVLDGTDVIVLTLFTTLMDVSVYSIYNLVVYGIRSLILAPATGIQAKLGALIVQKQKNALDQMFEKIDWGLHSVTTIVFGCTMILIIPFISIYTSGVKDTNYINTEFAVVITLAQGFRCIRLPYNLVILGGGHYKQTQSNYIIAAIINILVSVVFAIWFGLIGVAIGTLAAFLYQNVWMAHYVSRNIICWPFRNFVKQSLVDFLIILIGYFSTESLYFGEYTYVTWALNGLLVLSVWILISLCINFVFYKNRVCDVVREVKNFILR